MNIIVTGGASGLGEAITSKLAEDKNNVVYFTYFKSKENAAALEKKFANAKAIHCNFNDAPSLNNLLAQMETMQLNVLVNNAFSLLEVTHFHKIAPTSFADSFAQNIVPAMQLMQKALDIFRKEKSGKIITILSSAIINKPPLGWSKYVAEKNYLLSVCKSIALENASFNITSNCVSPAFMLTELTKETDERIIEEMTKKHPLKKLLTTAETADSVVFLVHATQQINGTNIIINAAADLV